ncbi:MAG: hypothetical protein ACXWV5_05965 [Flavitalea sp.]
MLVEIFHKIGEDLKTFVSEQKPESRKLNVHLGPEKKKFKNPQVSIQLFRFGYDNQHKNYPVAPQQDRSVYGFTFFILLKDSSYETGLDLMELICDHFDKKPFTQLNTGSKEYEVALSQMELSMEEINHFWIAQGLPHSPVLFYQARISEI